MCRNDPGVSSRSIATRLAPSCRAWKNRGMRSGSLAFAFLILVSVSMSARADRVLMIGDSLSCGPFGRRAVENLKTAGHEVTLYCMVGSAPEHWIGGDTVPGQICQTMTSRSMALEPCAPRGRAPKLKDILASVTADRVIVALGTNSLPGGSVASQAYAQMAKEVRSEGSCQWIGPPHLNPSQGIGWSRHRRGSPDDLKASRERLEQIQANLGPFYNSLSAKVDGTCPLVDSRPATASGPAHETNDGIHRGPIGGRTWANALRNQIGSAPRRATSRAGGGNR